MAKSIDVRYQSMKEVAADLTDLLRHRNRPANVSEESAAGGSITSTSEELEVFQQIAEDAVGNVLPGCRSRSESQSHPPGSVTSWFLSWPTWQRWTAVGAFGVVVLAGVVIIFDGSRVELDEGFEGEIRVTKEGGTSIHPTVSGGNANPTEGPDGSHWTDLTTMPITSESDIQGSRASSASEILTSSDWTWTGPMGFLPGPNAHATEFVKAYDQLTDVGAVCRVYEVGESPMRDLMMTTCAAGTVNWTAPVSVGDAINSAGDEASPCLSTDGLTLIFESDRPGGHGETGLWMSQRSSHADGRASPTMTAL